MIKKANLDIPLFISTDQPLIIYIINNKIVGCEITKTYNNNRFMAYFLLKKLANKGILKSICSENLLYHFENNYLLDVPITPCLCGFYESGFISNRCLEEEII